MTRYVLVFLLGGSTILAPNLYGQAPRIGTPPPDFEVTDATGQYRGKTLSYRAIYGERPTICILIRNNSDNITALMRDIDRLVERNAKLGLVAFVVWIGGRERGLTELAERENIRSVPLTMINSTPVGYDVGDVASVVMWRDSRVLVNRSFNGFDRGDIGRVMTETKRIIR